MQTYTAPRLPERAPETADTAEAFPGYERFEITRPENDATLRDNQGSVSIALQLEPGLHSDHKLEIFLNGELVGGGSSSSVQLRNVDRGTHTVHGVIEDASGKELARTAPVTFHLHRTFITRKPAPR